MLIIPLSLPTASFLAALRFSLDTAGTQRGLDQPGQLPARLDVDGLIDRLVGHPHLRIVGEIFAQPTRDLLRTVPLFQASHNLGEQDRVDVQLARFGAGPARLGGVLPDPGAIARQVAPRATSATNRRRMSLQQASGLSLGIPGF